MNPDLFPDYYTLKEKQNQTFSGLKKTSNLLLLYKH